jgi:glycosyltransferase involved in cell wall biosynthesis
MNSSSETTRCDLHLHSAASLTTGQWFSNYFQAPESYADPLRQYELCKARGMTLVTLTDHDTIDGGLQLIERPDFFLSVEVSTRFPENDCAVHVLVWNITPTQHDELQRRRKSVYDVSDYLRSEALAYCLPHPLLSPNWKLDAVTLEKCLALFPTFEAVNGLLDRRTDADVGHFFASITPGVLAALSRKHGIPLAHGTPARLALTAGSDDHGQRRCGTIFTEVDGKLDTVAYLRRVMVGDSRLVGQKGDLNAMAMCIKQAAYEHFRRRPGGEGGRRNPFVDVMDVIAGRTPNSNPESSPRGSWAVLEGILQATQRICIPAGLDLDITHIPEQGTDENDRRIVDAVARVSDTMAGQAAEELGKALIAFDIYGALTALVDLAAALGVASPLLFAADHFGRQDAQLRRVWENWTITERPRRSEYMAVFSDALDKIDGVSSWCNRFSSQASMSGRRVWFAACDASDQAGSPSTVSRPFPAIARFALPFYSGFEIAVPSLAATVDRLWREGITHVEVATPGPMGVVGVAAARILRLPVTATYHTDLPDLVNLLTGQSKFADLTRGYLGRFYRSVDRVFVLSGSSRDKLLGMGVPSEKIEIMPVAVDPEDFSPKRSSPTIFSDLGLSIGDRPVILSIGRLSEEKNVASIIEAVEQLQNRQPAPFLVVVGDGPARTKLEQKYRDKRHVAFVGFQAGSVLRKLYASAHAFVFASQVDTLGLVNLEALASGVPLLVPIGSAIAASLSDGHNASFFSPDANGLTEKLCELLDDPIYASGLARNGRQHMLTRWQEAQFDGVWQAMVGTKSTHTVTEVANNPLTD